MAAELIALFREHNWVVTTEQLFAAGLSPRQIGRLERRGILVSSRRGMYVPGKIAEISSRDGSRTEALRVGEAIARSGTGLIGSHRSAAIMHGLDLLAVASGRVVTVTQPRRASGNRSGYPGLRMYTADVPPTHLTTRFGVPCTTVPRTVIDVARNGSFDEGVVVADSALHAKLATRSELRTVLAECAHWPGVVNARRAVEFGDRRSESVLESVARVAMHEHGLEPPELQVRVGAGGRRLARADFLWRAHRTIAEADGKATYDRATYDRERRLAPSQLERDARLREAGFEVVHFTWAEIVYAPEQVMARILAAFRRAELLGLS